MGWEVFGRGRGTVELGVMDGDDMFFFFLSCCFFGLFVFLIFDGEKVRIL